MIPYHVVEIDDRLFVIIQGYHLANIDDINVYSLNLFVQKPLRHG